MQLVAGERNEVGLYSCCLLPALIYERAGLAVPVAGRLRLRPSRFPSNFLIGPSFTRRSRPLWNRINESMIRALLAF